MDPLTLLLMGGASSLIGGVGNYFSQMSASDRAKALQDQSMQEWLKINIPDPAQQKLALEQFVQQGTMTPELEHAVSQGQSEMSKVNTNSTQKSAQLRALSQMEDIGNSGGMRLQDKAALQDAMMDSNVKERADRNAITADMARRGMGGSGFELAAQLGAQQAGADRNAQSSMSAAAKAQDRALQAIMDSGDLSGKLRSQDFGEQSQKAQAQDAINRFNTSNLQDVQSRNVAARNQAQLSNLNAKQQIANLNTNLSNDQQRFNKGLTQQQFENQSKIAAGKTGQYGQMQQNATQQGQQTGNLFSNIGQAGLGAFTAAATNKAKSPSYASLPPGYEDEEEQLYGK